jgi:ABC-type enterochelin transport system ATPase subunit
LKEGKVLNSGKAKDIINVGTLKQIYGDVITTSEELNYNEITFKQG